MNECLTISVPEAGKRAFGCGRDKAYDLAREGKIPVIEVGSRKRVPIRWLQTFDVVTKPEAA